MTQPENPLKWNPTTRTALLRLMHEMIITPSRVEAEQLHGNIVFVLQNLDCPEATTPCPN